MLFWGLAILLLLAAWRWGEWPELTVAAVNLVAPIATRFVRTPLPIRYHHLESGILIVDVAALAIFLFVAIRADRWWPLFATALLMVSMLGHLARESNPLFLSQGYSIAGLAVYGVEVVLAIGIARARWRARATIT